VQPSISIKPHHFVDIITSFGKGERIFHPHPYGHALHTISKRILTDRELALKIELGIDDICKPCLHNACGRLAIEQDDQFSAHELCDRIRDKMGDITNIYREIPADMTAERNASLIKGLEFYLGQKKILSQALFILLIFIG